jgi:hypothetical protein
MASLKLVGRLVCPEYVKVLREVTKAAKLRDIIFDEESLEFSGDLSAIESGLMKIGNKDVIDPDFNRSTFSRDFPERRVRRLLAKGKEARFEDCLESKNGKKCLGNTAWRFITPRTTSDRDSSMADKMLACKSCPDFGPCSAMTLLRVLSRRDEL